MDYDTPIRSVEHAQWCLTEAAERYGERSFGTRTIFRSSKMGMASAIRIRFSVLWVPTGVALLNCPTFEGPETPLRRRCRATSARAAPLHAAFNRCPSASTTARVASPYISWFVARLPRADMASRPLRNGGEAISQRTKLRRVGRSDDVTADEFYGNLGWIIAASIWDGVTGLSLIPAPTRRVGQWRRPNSTASRPRRCSDPAHPAHR
jgi:hypothetical protein